MSACRPTTNARTWSRCCAPSARVLGEDDRVLVIDDNSPDGTGELADRLAGELAFVDVLHRAAQGGPRPGVSRRLPPRARFGRGAGGRDRLRLLTRPGRRAAPARRRRGRRRPRARLTLRARRQRRELGPDPARDLGRRLDLRPARAGRAGARPDRRLQVLPPRRAGGGRPRRGCTRAATPSRSS